MACEGRQLGLKGGPERSHTRIAVEKTHVLGLFAFALFELITAYSLSQNTRTLGDLMYVGLMESCMGLGLTGLVWWSKNAWSGRIPKRANLFIVGATACQSIVEHAIYRRASDC